MLMGKEGVRMAIWSAVGYYAGRLVLFSAVAALGIALGIKIRKAKNSKETEKMES